MQAGPQHDGLDHGPRKGGPGSERFCAATGTVRPVAEMIRFVVSPDGTVVPDLRRKLPGRGLWITATRPALRSALVRKAFAKGFTREVRVAADLVEATERLIERAALDGLAMAHKAGLAALGFTKVEAALAQDRAVGLIHASDAAADGVRKLDAALRQRTKGAAETIVIGAFTAAQLSLAFGRPNVIHAALLAGPESKTFLMRTARLECFRTGLTDRPENPGTRERNG